MDQLIVIKNEKLETKQFTFISCNSHNHPSWNKITGADDLILKKSNHRD